MYVLRRRTRIEIWTPAKINLFLEVLGRRDDGFHEIETLMVPISLFDTLRVSTRDDARIELRCRWVPGYGSADDLCHLPCDERNLVVRALRALMRHSGAEIGATVELDKRIPSAAGLGGGSSDAAAALVAANLVWNLNWPIQRLAEVACEVGSDVPYFLYGRAAVCRGRGEQVEPISHQSGQHFVVVRPSAGLSTPDVYRQTSIPRTPNRVAPLLECMGSGKSQALSQQMFNRLQFAAATVSPAIERLKAEFARVDVLGHQMSGSGSSYFGLCRSARHAQNVSSVLHSRRVGRVFRVSTLSRGSSHSERRLGRGNH